MILYGIDNIRDLFGHKVRFLSSCYRMCSNLLFGVATQCS